MVIVGLTGGIGSGKSYVAGIFGNLNVPVYNSDIEAKKIMDNSDIVRSKLIEKFGQNVIDNNIINRKYLASQVFSNVNNLNWLNNLVHPLVNQHFNNWAQTQQNTRYVIKEAAILIESGWYQNCDIVIAVTAPVQTRIERVMARDKITRLQVIERIKNQIDDNERFKYCQYIINNDGLNNIPKQVEQIHKNILNNINK